jgi:hypothetical protein
MKTVDPITMSENLISGFRLPHVGIPRLRALELQEYTGLHRNPYSIPKRTELMLLNNERLRMQEKVTREKMKNLYSIHEKGTFNFRNREGVIREIRSILPIDEQPGYQHSMTANKKLKKYNQIMSSTGERLNIFEGDPKDIDEKLRMIERENVVNTQQLSLESNAAPTQNKDINNRSSKWNGNRNYVKSQLQAKKSKKELANQSREPSFMEIYVRSKKEESEKLKELEINNNIQYA